MSKELSPTETQIAKLIADGLSNTEIAERLGIAHKTVRNHISHAVDKVGVPGRKHGRTDARTVLGIHHED